MAIAREIKIVAIACTECRYVSFFAMTIIEDAARRRTIKLPNDQISRRLLTIDLLRRGISCGVSEIPVREHSRVRSA